jgi:hypothetical protein
MLFTKDPTYLCSFPKSGRTWLRFILFNYFNLVYNLGADLSFASMFTMIPNDDESPQRGVEAYKYWHLPGIPLIVCSHSTYKSDVLDGKSIILLLRSPYDTLVSWYFHSTKQWDWFQGDMKTFIRDGTLGVESLIDYVNSWAKHISRHRHILLTYEDMHRDLPGVIKEVLLFVRVEVRAELLKRAIEMSSFETMVQMEIEGGIPGHSYDAKDIDARRVRRGIIGQYEHHLDKSDQEFILLKCRERLTEESKKLFGSFF